MKKISNSGFNHGLGQTWLAVSLLTVLTVFSPCKKDEPFDTQDPNDEPQILKPYNESGSGSFDKTIAADTIPYVDSVVVTPSRYTTVHWYVDDVLAHTGIKINKCFPNGVHSLRIEAVTTAGKSTDRFGTLTVGVDPNQLWAGSCVIDWGSSNVNISTADMAKVPAGSKILVYFETPASDYYAFRVTVPDWSADLVKQIDGFDSYSSPYSFTYDDQCKSLVDTKGGMLVTGHGINVTKIRFE